MATSVPADRPELVMQGFRVARGEDRVGEHHHTGGILSFKVLPADSHGTLLAIELVHHVPGGPPRHLHHEQDEWFYVIEGQYLLEVGGEQFHLGAGDSGFGPRGVPHAWTHLGHGRGRMAVTITPAGRLEAFFRRLSAMGTMAPQDPAFWPPYGLQLVGPPLPIGAGGMR